MKITLITVTYQAEKYLRACIDSVLTQDYPDFEYLIIDGGSTDGTLDILKSYGERVNWISEKDKGLYDAMNKGIARAKGQFIGMLNADDFYPHPSVLSHVAAQLSDSGAQTLFGDLVYVKADVPEEMARYYPGKGFRPQWYLQGNMPPHPTFFVEKELYQRFGGFDLQFKIVADFDFMARLHLANRISWTYLPEVMVHMRLGGASTSGIKSTITINREMQKAVAKYGFRVSLFRLYLKYFAKIAQLWRRPANK